MVLADGSAGDRERGREPRPLLGDPRRRRQLRRRHRVHVPGAPARDDRRRADVLGDRGLGRAPRGLSRVAPVGAAQRDGVLQLPHDPAGGGRSRRSSTCARCAGSSGASTPRTRRQRRRWRRCSRSRSRCSTACGRMPIAALNGAFDGLYGPGDQWYWRGDFLREIPDEAIAREPRVERADARLQVAARTSTRSTARSTTSRAEDTAFALPRRDLVAGLHRRRSGPGVGVGALRDWTVGYREAIVPVLGGRRLRQLHDGRRGPGRG